MGAAVVEIVAKTGSWSRLEFVIGVGPHWVIVEQSVMQAGEAKKGEQGV